MGCNIRENYSVAKNDIITENLLSAEHFLAPTPKKVGAQIFVGHPLLLQQSRSTAPPDNGYNAPDSPGIG